MRLRTSTSGDDGAGLRFPFKLPGLRNKTNDGLEEPGQVDATTRESKRKTVADFFKGAGNNLKTASDRIPARSNTRKPQFPPKRTQRDGSASSYDVKDDVLDRILGAPKDSPKMPSENFFLQQRVRASSKAGAYAAGSPYSSLSQAERDRQPISAEELTEMFEGAPYFSVERQRDCYRPRVIFKGNNVEASARYGKDYVPPGHPAFESCTLDAHQQRTIEEKPASDCHTIESSGTVDEFREIPSMLSALGNDLGTTGFECFLQLPIADSTMPQEERPMLEKRALILSDPEHLGLRELDIELLVNRLTELNELLTSVLDESTLQGLLNEEKIAEMGEDLFANVLSSELGTTIAGTGSVTLKTQVDALQKLLDTKDLWHDFSVVEWRIRVGQLLWAVDDTEADEAATDDVRQPSERDVLLLQVCLAAELLVRVKLVEASTTTGGNETVLITKEESLILQNPRSIKICWDMLLAERFLGNLSVSAKLPDGGEAGNRSSFFSAISFVTAREDDTDLAAKPLLFPKNEEKQLSGLLAFAEAIAWPHVADVKSQLTGESTSSLAPPSSFERPTSMMSEYLTPLSSPALPSTPGARNSYFAVMNSSPSPRRPAFSRTTTAQSMQLMPSGGKQMDGFEVGGWISRSWLAGLVLPGEAAGHFLISTLLENSPRAIDALGDCANLYGGFSYAGRTYWSKSCVVGRVMAAIKGSAECMGWISVPLTPEGQPDGWLNIEARDCPYPSTVPRIRTAELVGRESDPLHGNSAVELQAGDFTQAVDGPPVMGNEVRSHGLTLTSTIHTPIPEDSTFGSNNAVAYLEFSSPLNNKLGRLSVPLSYDVHFVSSYPCYPAPATRNNALSSPIEEPESAKSDSAYSFIEKELPPPPAHPLHVDYRYKIVPVATLLNMPKEQRARALTSPGLRPSVAIEAEPKEVVVLDCKGTEDLELLARAWCAKVGENALIGKSGRTCLGCCVREASALDIGVVIRI